MKRQARPSPTSRRAGSNEDWQRHHDDDRDHKNPPPKPKKETKKSTNSHSESEVWTAGAIGAVIGAVLAKNT
ncbi:MAG: hypothetical protein SPL62_01955 [Selenomonas sp.]|uniref:hypothetical protein n=1 Tax=uncultured Selenomonas sp. TaxID=159275 RepID=UPI0025F104C4|nr:hypothetical protein [uncultured Selenomonas sp.]MDD6128777.1 hypothetical protein [Veillonellaceae bacterium]MDY6349244.1 hypothetical protein [Selenomonas sp.]